MISFYLFTLSHELSHMSLAETLPRIFLNPKVHCYSVITTSNSIFLKQQQNFDCLPPKYTQLLCQHATATALVHSPFLGPWVMRFSHCLHILHWLPRHLQHWQSHTGDTALSDISSLSVLNRQRLALEGVPKAGSAADGLCSPLGWRTPRNSLFLPLLTAGAMPNVPMCFSQQTPALVGAFGTKAQNRLWEGMSGVVRFILKTAGIWKAAIRVMFCSHLSAAMPNHWWWHW